MPTSESTKSTKARFSFLFLDDSVHRRNQVRRLLQDEPIRFVWASTADEAIAALRKRKYDIVSLDHDLSGHAVFVPDYPGDLPTIQEQFGAQARHTPMHELDGLDVAKALIDTPNVDSYLFIHSMNPVGAGHMKNLLPQATWLPYQHIWLEVNMIKAWVRHSNVLQS
jgi:CheY-like chemotaxis protein